MDSLWTWMADICGLDETSGPPAWFADAAPWLSSLRDRMERTGAALLFYQAAINALPNPIFVKNDELRYVFFNRRYKEFFSLEDGQYMGQTVYDLPYLSEADRERYAQEDRAAHETRSVVSYETTFPLSPEELRESLYWSRGFEAEGGLSGIIGEIVDISQQKRLQRELARHAAAFEQVAKVEKERSKRDPLTGLLNRSVFVDEIPLLLAEAKDTEEALCAIIVDIDNFKYINDNYGHMEGDRVLAAFADVMRSAFRRSDILIRYGGDEFVAVLRGMTLDCGREAAERFCNAVCRTVILPGGESVSISVGIAAYRREDNIFTFLTRADEALYAAKQSGKNRVVAIP